MAEEPDKRVCTCGAGFFCTFECEYCDAFKEPEEAAKEAAEDERDRLNAEYRKEQSND